MASTGTARRHPLWPPRGRVADAAVALGAGAAVAGWTLVSVAGLPSPPRPGPLEWLLVLGACGALYLRRRFPVAVMVATLAACAVYYPLHEPDGPILVTFFIALYTAAAGGHLAAAIVVGTVALLGTAYGWLSSTTRFVDDWMLLQTAGWLVAVIAVGGVTSNRRAYLREAQQHALDAERGKEAEARRRATEERLRIARELHDVLGHHISLINVQAGAALHRLERDAAGGEPPPAAAALATIKDASREALRDLRATLGVLRQVDEEAPTAPAPGLHRLGELVERAAAAGIRVRTVAEGEARPLPPEVDLAAYRIVQEALTNVARHARAATATVAVHYGDHGVDVRVEDDGRGSAAAPGTAEHAGTGLHGMAERARALGGEFSAGDRPGGGFQVAARLPIDGGETT
ncbi:sensor histidine kinase [Allonocardiopsis opalescens]|nr:histidine kinase [Allonocardiopsis opalescens]